MTLLETIRGPRDLDALSKDQLEQLAAEVREFLIAKYKTDAALQQARDLPPLGEEEDDEGCCCDDA